MSNKKIELDMKESNEDKLEELIKESNYKPIKDDEYTKLINQDGEIIGFIVTQINTEYDIFLLKHIYITKRYNKSKRHQIMTNIVTRLNKEEYINIPTDLKKYIKKRKGKNYYKNKQNNKYCVAKWRNNKKICQIVCDTEEEAQEIVQYLIEHDWSEESIQEIKEFKKKMKQNKYKFYTKIYGKYYVQKYINNKLYSYGGYDTEKEAQEIVEYLKQNNWSKEALKKYREMKV